MAELDQSLGDEWRGNWNNARSIEEKIKELEGKITAHIQSPIHSVIDTSTSRLKTPPSKML